MKKLIIPFFMLLLSLSLLTTSTFAWFSMNKQVEATNLKLTAESESIYLLISATNTTASTIQAEKSIRVVHTETADECKVFPSAYSVSSGTDLATVGNWYTADALDPGSSAVDSSSITALTTFDKYVIHHTYYFTLAEGSKPATNLKVAGYSITSNNLATGANPTFEAVKTVVACGSVYEELESTDTEGSAILNSTNLTDSSVTVVDVYIYLDGNEDCVYTNNISNLESVTIDLTFSVTAA